MRGKGERDLYMSENILREKVGMLCYGVKFPDFILNKFNRYKYKRASLSEGIYIHIIDGERKIPLNVAGFEKFVEKSPYEYENGFIKKNGEKIFRAEIIYDPPWYFLKLKNGKPITAVLQSHGKDVLTSCLSSFCIFSASGEGCKFCAINSSLAGTNSPFELEEAIEILFSKGFSYHHLNLNSGTPRDTDEFINNFSSVIKKVKEKFNLRIYLQMCPCENYEILEIMKNSGVDSVSFNLEIFDDELRKEICPGKGKIKKDLYAEWFSRGEKIFGRGNVSSWLIAGLEPAESTKNGIDFILESGAIPFLTVFRPLKGSPMEDKNPPLPEDVLPAFEHLYLRLKEKNFPQYFSKTGCVNCDCCSILSLIK